MYQCLVEGCAEKFRSSRDRKDHLVTSHLYPVDFRFDRPPRGQGCASPNALCLSTEAMGVDREQPEEDTMEVCSAHTVSPTEPTGERLRPRHRIPSTICFGQGALRGFKSTKKRTKH